MKKISYVIFLIIGLLISNMILANPQSPCNSTWVNSSAAQSCGPGYCDGGDVIMKYNWETNQCTFSAYCCQGGDMCPGPGSGTCLNSEITVKKGNSHINNCNAFLTTNNCVGQQKMK
jgi:hypothetical protein